MIDTQPTLDGFVDDAPEAAPAGPPPIVVGRSELERWSTCPMQALLIDRKAVSTGSELADVGNEVHAIMSAAVRARTDGADFRSIRDDMEQAAAASRPDVQPAVLDAINVYRCASLVCSHDTGERHPDDIIRFDGGDGARSGQLSAELLPAEGDRGPLVITGELDFLAATPSVEEVDLLDWKSGWRHWTGTEVAESFQFGFYALLVWRNYPPVQRVRVRVVETRTGNTTAAIVFDRARHQARIHARVMAAAGLFLKYRGAESPEDVEAWPAPAKCNVCDAASACLQGFNPDGADVASDPAAYLKRYVVAQEQADRMKAALTVWRRKQPSDLIVPGVGAFGTDKPKAVRAATCDLYAVGGQS